MNYGKAINNLRVDRMKQTQTIFAKSIGITQTYLSQIENGIKKPSTDLLDKISIYVEIPMPLLFWYSITEKDIKKRKLEAYRMLKPAADALIESFF